MSTLSSSLQFTFNFGNKGQSTSVSSHSTAHSFSYGTTSGSLGSIYLGSLFFVSGYNRRSVGVAPLLTLCKEHDCTSRVSCRPEALKRECRPIRGIPVHTAVGDTPTGMFVLARDPTCSSSRHKAVAVKPVCQFSSSMSENASTHSARCVLTSPQLASTFGFSSLCLSILVNTIVVTHSRPQATFSTSPSSLPIPSVFPKPTRPAMIL